MSRCDGFGVTIRQMDPEEVLFTALGVQPDSQPAPSKPLGKICLAGCHAQADDGRIVGYPDDELPVAIIILGGLAPFAVITISDDTMVPPMARHFVGRTAAGGDQ